MGRTSDRSVRRRIGAAVRELRGGSAPVPRHSHPKLGDQVQQLRAEVVELRRRLAGVEKSSGELDGRVSELDDDLLEQRSLSLRVAELADVVAGLLAEAARGDQDRFRAALAQFADGL